jgi:hypothetical protein
MELRVDPRGSLGSRTNRRLPFGHTPDHAERLVRVLYDAPATLLTFPNRGRPGKKDGTRELVLSPLPYILVYAVWVNHYLFADADRTVPSRYVT